MPDVAYFRNGFTSLFLHVMNWQQAKQELKDLQLANQQLEAERDRLKSDIERWKQEYAILLEGNNKLREENKLFANNLWASVKSNEKLREAFEELSEKYSEGREPIKDYWRKRAGLTDKEVGG